MKNNVILQRKLVSTANFYARVVMALKNLSNKNILRQMWQGDVGNSTKHKVNWCICSAPGQEPCTLI